MHKYLLNQWFLKKYENEEDILATVPGSVCLDLLNAQKMEDPFWGENEYPLLGMLDRTFTYETSFDVDASLLKMDEVLCVFEGLDTLTEITLNGQSLGATNNMHRTYKYNVKHLLKETGNLLRVDFQSSLAYIKEKHEQEHLWGVSQGVDGYPHLRKAHYMYGWDWGPQIPDVGIWRPVYLEGFTDGKIEEVLMTQKFNEDLSSVSVICEVESLVFEDGVNLEIRTTLGYKNAEEIQIVDNGIITQAVNKVAIHNMDHHRSFEKSFKNKIELEVLSPKLWWPNNMGDQNLYELTVELLKDDKVIDVQTKTIGLRTLTVRTEKDQWGESFEFEINGISIFSMGGNYIPEDNIIGRMNRDKTERLIQDCVRANMNTIRVWGGGFYPGEDFYDLCDQYGLIVWQDMPFACALYRMNAEFTANIIAETRDNLLRIRHRASLGMLCGNNEMETAMMYWGGVKDCAPSLKTDFIKQYEFVLPETSAKYAPSTFFWKSSPSSGGHFDKPNDENYGDVHDWEVWHGKKPFTHFQDHYYRFLSEFGLQSFPSFKTVKTFTTEKDWNVFSPVMEAHQKNDSGNEKILYYISETFKYPKDFEGVLIASQMVQAEGIRYAVEHLRRHRGRCMGATYWQLNDCWPVASWASLDSCGRWKALHYAAKKFFAPVLISAVELKRFENAAEAVQVSGKRAASVYYGNRVCVTNDTFEPIVGKVTITWKDHTMKVLREEQVEVNIPAFSAEFVGGMDLKNEITSHKIGRSTFIGYALDTDQGAHYEGVTLFVAPKSFDWLEPNIQVEVSEMNTQFVVTLTAENFAKFVMLDLIEADGVFSDNYFEIQSSTPVVITCEKVTLSDRNMSLEDFKRMLTVKTLLDV